MRILSTAWKWLKRPLILGPVSAALGAAAVISILGVPGLWTPEGAGWASAFGTFLAATVAVGVAVVPRYHARQRERLAVKLSMEWFVDQLEDVERSLGNANFHRYEYMIREGGEILVPTGFGSSQRLAVVLPTIPITVEFEGLYRATNDLGQAIAGWNNLADQLPNQGGWDDMRNARSCGIAMDRHSATIASCIHRVRDLVAATFPEIDQEPQR